MKKVFVKGWVDETFDYRDGTYHSVPVRFKCEDGSYEWLWVRKNNVSLCTAKKPRGAKR